MEGKKKPFLKIPSNKCGIYERYSDSAFSNQLSNNSFMKISLGAKSIGWWATGYLYDLKYFPSRHLTTERKE